MWAQVNQTTVRTFVSAPDSAIPGVWTPWCALAEQVFREVFYHVLERLNGEYVLVRSRPTEIKLLMTYIAMANTICLTLPDGGSDLNHHYIAFVECFTFVLVSHLQASSLFRDICHLLFRGGHYSDSKQGGRAKLAQLYVTDSWVYLSFCFCLCFGIFVYFWELQDSLS